MNKLASLFVKINNYTDAIKIYESVLEGSDDPATKLVSLLRIGYCYEQTDFDKAKHFYL